jgi:hypothetical protein
MIAAQIGAGVCGLYAVCVIIGPWIGRRKDERWRRNMKHRS